MKTVIRNSYTPKTGDYCETIVVDKESGDAYIFDCDGVFTPMPQPVDVEDILRRAAEYTDETVAPLEEKLDTIEEGAQVNVIERIVQNGVELMPYEKTVSINTPTKTSDLTNDGSDGTDTYVESAALDDYYTKSETDTQIGYETDAREIADSGLQEQIDAIVASSDVVDIVGTYAALQAYDTTKLHDNDIIKVLTDETRDDATTYYRWDADTSTWSYIGAEGPFYTKAESDALFTPMTRTINGNALSSDITLTAADVHALPDSTVIPTVNDATLTIQKNGTSVATFTANSATNTTANITVPTDTSDLTNDGDGVSPFATEDYVDTYGGKIDKIEVNGVEQTIVNKTVDITVPTKTSDLTNDGSDGTSTYVEADDLATVATSGDYDDLINKPTIPTVNNATLTIQKNGTDVATFTANSATNKTANITVPTDTSDLTNGAGFITNSALSNYYTKSETYSQGEVNGLINSLNIPTKTSDLTNDSGFVSEDDLYSEVCDSGTTITFQGSPAAPLLSFGMAGNTVQASTPAPSAPVAVQTVTGYNEVEICGKNLWGAEKHGNLDENTGQEVANNNRWVTDGYIPVKSNTAYTLSSDAENLWYIFCFYDANQNFISGVSYYGHSQTQTTPANCKFVRCVICDTATTKTTQRQLELGSTATAYEAFKGQSYEVNLGKNLFNASVILPATITSYAGGTVSATSDTISISATSSDAYAPNIGTGSGYMGDNFYVDVSKASTATISFTTSSSSGVKVICYAYNASTNKHVNLGTISSGTSGSYNVASYDKILLRFGNTVNGTTLTYSDIQVELGSKTDFAPYFTPIELCKIGDYQDSIYKSGDKWYLRKEVGKATFTGEAGENWTRESGNRMDITIPSAVLGSSSNNPVFANMYQAAWAVTNGKIFLSGVYNGIGLCDNTNGTSVANYKTFLSSNPLVVYYALATPTDTEITNAELVAQLEAVLGGRTYSSATNISTAVTAGNAQGELEVCYTKTILPIATETSLGMVQIGSGLSITENGVLSATGGGGGSTDWSDITNKPTDVSYWTNDAGYITSAAIPTTVSSFTNDAGYITSAAIPTVVSAFTNDAGYLTSSALSNYYTKTETYSQGEVNSLINTISVPTKTSDLVNDGDDGVHAFLATDDVATVATSGDYDDLINKPVLPTYSDFTGATSGTAGAHGLVPAPAAGDQNKVLKGDGTWKEVSDKFIIMKYGESNAWAKFIDAYDNNKIVYCRASSNANPASGAQTRLAFMAYVSAETNPTNVEFQYVRSVSSKTSSQPVDQVFVYKLTNANGGTWSVETRDMAPKLAAGTNTSVSYSSGTYTVSATQPTVGDATLTIQKNGTTVDTFTANATSNKTINLTMPNITVQDTDPGEGAPLAADNYIGVYDVPASPIDGSRLITGSVATAALADGAVTTAKINNGAVTAAKMDTQSYSLTSLPAHSGGVDRYKVYRVGNLVTININSIWLNSVAKDSWTTLGALPAGLYPSSADDEQCGSATVLNDSGNVIGSCALIVNNAGNLQFKSGVARSGLSAIRGSMSYVITW